MQTQVVGLEREMFLGSNTSLGRECDACWTYPGRQMERSPFRYSQWDPRKLFDKTLVRSWEALAQLDRLYTGLSSNQNNGLLAM
jgi:hypothetical protein